MSSHLLVTRNFINEQNLFHNSQVMCEMMDEELISQTDAKVFPRLRKNIQKLRASEWQHNFIPRSN